MTGGFQEDYRFERKPDSLAGETAKPSAARLRRGLSRDLLEPGGEGRVRQEVYQRLDFPKPLINAPAVSHEHILRYTDLAAVIQMAKARGWPTTRIVREMSSGLPYVEAMKLARKVGPLLDLSISEFMRLRKNE
jgi:hypothetical protein